jgi:hypothetical protein
MTISQYTVFDYRRTTCRASVAKPSRDGHFAIDLPGTLNTIPLGNEGVLGMVAIVRACAVLLACLLVSSCTAGTELTSESPLAGGGMANTKLAAEKLSLNPSNLTASLNSLPNPEQQAKAAADISIGLKKDFADIFTECQPIFSGLDHDANSLRWWTLGIAMVGTVAGSIVVPALSAATNIDKVAIAAMGGLSGTANSAQSVLNAQGLTAASVMATRASIHQEMSAALTEYYTAVTNADPTKASLALQKARVACVLYKMETTPPK